MGEGLLFPACNTLLAAWTPLKERSITATVVYSGGMIGSIFGSSISGILISSYGWTSVFYIFGGVSVVWLILFVSIDLHNNRNVDDVFVFLNIVLYPSAFDLLQEPRMPSIHHRKREKLLKPRIRHA